MFKRRKMFNRWISIALKREALCVSPSAEVLYESRYPPPSTFHVYSSSGSILNTLQDIYYRRKSSSCFCACWNRARLATSARAYCRPQHRLLCLRLTLPWFAFSRRGTLSAVVRVRSPAVPLDSTRPSEVRQPPDSEVVRVLCCTRDVPGVLCLSTNLVG